MRQLRIIIILAFSILIVIFSVQNAEVVEVRFLSWKVETSRALLMLTCAVIGSISTILALLPSLVARGEKGNESRLNVKGNNDD